MISADIFAIALCLFSAVTVALANFAVKRGRDVLTARMVMSGSMAIMVLPFAFFVPLPPAHMWLPIFGAVLVHGGYEFAMIRALHRGDLSLVFPVMRGLGPLAVAIFAFILLGERLNALQIVGLLAASASLIVFAVPTELDAAKRKQSKAALLWAGLTALGIGAYASVDAHIVRAMPNTFTFIIWLFLLDWIGVSVVAIWTRRGEVWTRVKPQLRSGILGGLAGTFSYGAALYAYTLLNATMVTALRETSVVFAAILGAIFLKENFGPRRMVAASVLAAGLICMRLAA